jgi:hypothetical protein
VKPSGKRYNLREIVDRLVHEMRLEVHEVVMIDFVGIVPVASLPENDMLSSDGLIGMSEELPSEDAKNGTSELLKQPL